MIVLLHTQPPFLLCFELIVSHHNVHSRSSIYPLCVCIYASTYIPCAHRILSVKMSTSSCRIFSASGTSAGGFIPPGSRVGGFPPPTMVLIDDGVTKRSKSGRNGQRRMKRTHPSRRACMYTCMHAHRGEGSKRESIKRLPTSFQQGRNSIYVLYSPPGKAGTTYCSLYPTGKALPNGVVS